MFVKVFCAKVVGGTLTYGFLIDKNIIGIICSHHPEHALGQTVRCTFTMEQICLKQPPSLQNPRYFTIRENFAFPSQCFKCQKSYRLVAMECRRSSGLAAPGCSTCHSSLTFTARSLTRPIRILEPM